MKIVAFILLVALSLTVRIQKKHKKQHSLQPKEKQRMKKLNKETQSCNKYKLEINDEIKVMENFHGITYKPCEELVAMLGLGQKVESFCGIIFTHYSIFHRPRGSQNQNQQSVS